MQGGPARYSAGSLFFVLVFDFFYFEELAQEKKDFRAFNDNNFHEKDPLNLN